MSIQHYWPIGLAFVILLSGFYCWRGQKRWLLKALSLAFILLALAEPVLTVWRDRLSVIFLLDTSLSVPSSEIEQAIGYIQAARQSQGTNLSWVVPFAGEASEPIALQHFEGITRTDHPSLRATNLERAIQLALALPRPDTPGRIVLLSDGQETSGSVLRGSWLAAHLGVPIDVVPLRSRERPAQLIESVRAPARVFAGERLGIELLVHSVQPSVSQLVVSLEGKTLTEREVHLKEGTNRIQVQVRVPQAGAYELSVELKSAQAQETAYVHPLTVVKPRVLLFSSYAPDLSHPLEKVLERGGFEIHRAELTKTTQLEDYELVILDNVDYFSLERPVQEKLVRFVEEGGGLLTLSGDQHTRVQPALQAREHPLQQLLPARIKPPEAPHGNCVVLILDKSSSMEGRKMELARMAAIGVIDHLRDEDKVGVLAFDNTYQWAVPIRPARNRSLIKRIIAGILPDGGTQIAPALEEAYRRARTVTANVKHMVLLTDGISEEGNSMQVAREAREHNITISTIGLGQDVNRSYLERVASLAGGKSYFLSDPSGLKQILLKDVLEHTLSTAVEKPTRIVVQKPVEAFTGLKLEQAPLLGGYIRHEAKPTADVLLSSPDSDPLLVRWNYGLGRVTVFASDAIGRWSAPWVQWPGFSDFWLNVARDLLPRADEPLISSTFDQANDQLILKFTFSRPIDSPQSLPELYAVGNGNFRKLLKLEFNSEREVQATLQLQGYRGFLRIRPLQTSRLFPEQGIYLPVLEFTQFGTNEFLLQQIASSTGGKFQPAPEEVFRKDGRVRAAKLSLWPGLLALGLLLNLVEITLRKWPQIIARLPLRARN